MRAPFPSTILYIEAFTFVTDCSDCVLPFANDDTLFGVTGEVGEVDEAPVPFVGLGS